MKIKHLPRFLILIVITSACYEAELPYHTCENGIPVRLLAQDHSETVCGGHYIFAKYDTDTLRIQYSEVLRDFFVDHSLTAEDFPIAADVVLKQLPQQDTCASQLQTLECIALGYIRSDELEQ